MVLVESKRVVVFVFESTPVYNLSHSKEIVNKLVSKRRPSLCRLLVNNLKFRCSIGDVRIILFMKRKAANGALP